MKELKENLTNIACDLSIALMEVDFDNVDYMDNACCRVSDLIYDLQKVYKKMCEKADDMRYGRA
jgi:anti-anti-sigma regulatory factor